MALTTRVWSAGKLLLLGAALLATYVLFAAGAARVALKARELKVPDLRGRSVNAASEGLAEVGLTLRVDDVRRPDAKVPAGHIAIQEPAAGSTARRGRSIKVWLSSGPRASTVPRLVGETERTAQLRLQQDGLTLGPISEILSSDYPPASVVAQAPPPDSHASTVSLLINRGDRVATYLMPDLIGVNGDRAADILRAHGFRVAVVGNQPYPGVPPGVVVRQTPQGGFQIAPGEPISLEVNR